MTKHLSLFLYVVLLVIPAGAFAASQNFHALTVSYKTYANATSAWHINEKERKETASFTEPELKVFNEQGRAVLAVTDAEQIAATLNGLPGNLHTFAPVPGERSLEDELRITRDASGKAFNTASLIKPTYTLVLYVLPAGMCGPCDEMSSLMKQQSALAKNAGLNFAEVTIAM